MFDYFKNLFSSENDQDPGFTRLVRVVLTLSTAATVIIAIVLALTLKKDSLWTSVGIIFIMAILSGVSLFLSYRNILWPGKALLPLTILVGVTCLAINANGLHDSSIVGFTFVIIITSLITGQKAIPLATFLTLLGVWTVAYADLSGITQSTMAERTAVDDIVVISVIQVIAATSLNGLMTRLNSALEASRSNELILEQRVAERIKALQVSAEISRRLTAILDPRDLAKAVVTQVQSVYDYYYAQIYLFDAAGENLVLTAGTGEAGAVMMKRGHALPKGRGLVGRAAENNLPVLVPDTSQASDWLPNELLPHTKAEAAIPIAIGDRVLGVLDVQDSVTNDITPDDIILLESLASQVAISLQNAESYTKAESALQEAKSLVEYAAEGIAILDLSTGLFTEPNENAQKIFGLSHDEISKVGPAQMSPASQPDGRDSTEKALEQIGVAMEKGINIFEWNHINAQGHEFPCEIRLVRLPGTHPRIRLSLLDITERKHLQELTAQRARQQEALNLITQKIQSAATIESALQVTARELGRALGMKPTLVTIEPDRTNGARKSVS